MQRRLSLNRTDWPSRLRWWIWAGDWSRSAVWILVGTAVIDIAIGKAYTAASMRQPSANLEGVGVESSAPTAIPGIMPFGGGVPIEIDGRIVGGHRRFG